MYFASVKFLVHPEMDDICLSSPTGSVSVSVWYGSRGILVPQNDGI